MLLRCVLDIYHSSHAVLMRKRCAQQSMTRCFYSQRDRARRRILSFVPAVIVEDDRVSLRDVRQPRITPAAGTGTELSARWLRIMYVIYEFTELSPVSLSSASIHGFPCVVMARYRTLSTMNNGP